MVGFAAILLSPIPSITRPLLIPSPNSKILPSFFTTIPIRNPRNPRRRLVVSAKDDNGGPNKDSKQRGSNGNNGQEDLKKDQKVFFNFNWRNLLDPDPENIVAVGLTGLLTWASVQVLYQLFFISIAILVAALKIISSTEWLESTCSNEATCCPGSATGSYEYMHRGCRHRYRNNAEITARHRSVSNMFGT